MIIPQPFYVIFFHPSSLLIKISILLCFSLCKLHFAQRKKTIRMTVLQPLLYVVFMYVVLLRILVCLQEKDPFWEPTDANVLIGKVHVYLQSLAYKVNINFINENFETNETNFAIFIILNNGDIYFKILSFPILINLRILSQLFLYFK